MHDVLIAGGGPVGAALALSLRHSDLDIALIDSGEGPDTPLRPIALSQASRLILDRLIPDYVATAGTPIRSVHVSQSEGFGRTLISETDLDVPALGYVFNLGDLAHALNRSVDCTRIKGRLTRWDAGDDGVQARIRREEQTLEAKARLLIIADGGQFAGDDLALRDYGQNAVVAWVRPEQPPQGRAWERFRAEGPLALLPFGERYALVWTTTPSQARALLAMKEMDFLRALQKAFGHRLGSFVEAGPRSSFPLQLRFRTSPVAGPRSLIIGNAAQTLHPVAGQGLNLGLRDAFELAELLRPSRQTEIGTNTFLEKYRVRRGADRQASIAATDSLVRFFSADIPSLRPLRGIALTALDLIPPLRRVFARRMVYGLRNLP